MICPKCRAYVTNEDVVCPVCGAAVYSDEPADEGLQAFRQGKKQYRAPQDADSTGKLQPIDPPHRRRKGASREQFAADDPAAAAMPVFGASEDRPDSGYDRYQPRGEKQAKNAGPQKKDPKAAPYGRTYQVKSRMINWAHAAIALAVLAVIAAAGFYAWMSMTAEGQRFKARHGMQATATAKWEIGTEHLDNGRIPEAIALFETAWAEQGEEAAVNDLLLLGAAYEADDRLADAESLYIDLYTNIVPTRSEPYTCEIRIMLAQGRTQEAADLMETAYEKTGRDTFRNQRKELIPAAPEVNLVAGYYTENKTLVLTSAEGFDIYYTFSSTAVLPDEGQRYERPITLDEGLYTLRAIAVNGQLRSDELKGEYKIIMPSPRTPGATLAPNTYNKARDVWLRVAEDNKYDTDITLYYTIDGSNCDADSPIYTGDPIKMPNGYVTLKAIAVNGYGKVSNQLEILYKFTARPWPLEAYSTDDTLAGMSLYYTKRADFFKKYGEGEKSEDVELEGFSFTGRKYYYSWGYAVFCRKSNTDWILTELYFASSTFVAPRGTGIGQSESEITGAFRDMGQIESPSGNRGLYSVTKGSGKVYRNEDGTKLIRYIATTSDSYYWTLEYNLDKTGSCRSVLWKFSKTR